MPLASTTCNKYYHELFGLKRVGAEIPADPPSIPRPWNPPFAASRSFENLVAHLEKYYSQPDILSIRAILSSLVAHAKASKPVWLLITGPAGSGKTAISVSVGRAAGNSMVLSEISRAAFLSGFRTAQPNGNGTTPVVSALSGPSLVWIFKDFTTMLALPPNERPSVLSKLKEAWDGEVVRSMGNGPKLTWKGKLTVLACTTSQVELELGKNRAFGDRFLVCRWHESSDAVEMAGKMEQQRQNRDVERLITTLALGALSYGLTNPAPAALTRDQRTTLATLCHFAAVFRITTSRSYGGTIDSIAEKESLSRLLDGSEQIALAHAQLQDKTQVDHEDMFLAEKLILDSIPSRMIPVISGLLGSRVPGTRRLNQLPQDKLRDHPGLKRLPKTLFYRLMEDLEAIGAIDRANSRNFGADLVEFSPEVREMVQKLSWAE